MTPPVPGAGPSPLWGRTFLHPALDYLLIGGGLSLVATGFVFARPSAPESVGPLALAWVLLVSNMAHFASSTVRLYTRPGATRTWPVLTQAVPLLSLALLTLCIARPEGLGLQLQKLYLTWSPYHYRPRPTAWPYVQPAIRLSPLAPRPAPVASRRRAAVPVGLPERTPVRLGWLLPAEARGGAAPDLLELALDGIRLLALAGPVVLALKIGLGRRDGAPMPLIAPLLLISNGVWWFVLPELHPFIWATVFHGIQYLAIVLVFHVREQLALPGNQRGALYHGLRFYALSLLLGYALFRVLPQGYCGWASARWRACCW